ncbi:protein phosphatase 2C domain-containing protein [Ktedonobacter racemifer]|uniref:Protein serine/threonine phosphatase n=1 Tax=Ktedonobacter racemifer DSM 44963 TaxID=485913 RepID=D6U8K5_KTERA|nr:protein phosphatase 2C domain-containing protein [Ktedonobacter racemifer]EFH80216.1 protein serine/threonine phosphatase [Ktedonobacter racemifer DSM 44963]
MQDTHEPKWGIIEASVAGATHKQNQDAKKTHQDPGYSLLAVADGHGSKAYTRSAQGAQLAVESAIQGIEYLLNQLPPLTDISHAMIEHILLTSSPVKIVEQWRKQVEENIKTQPFVEGADQHSYPFKPYGTTLLTALVTSSFIFYSQIGDGDILVVTEDGHVYEPVPGDVRLFANETTSLSSKHAEHDFRKTFKWLSEQDSGSTPALIMLATDGYRNSFTSEADFFKVATDILNLLRQQGPDYVQQHLEKWLQTATDLGSGDDITVVLFWNNRLLQTHRKTITTQGSLQVPADQEPIAPGSEAENIYMRAQEESANISSIQMQPPAPSDRLLFSNTSFHHTPKQIGSGIETLFQGDFKAHKADQRAILVVSQEPGLGDYTSITEALQFASDGSTIIAYPGEYQEQLNIERNICIKAKEPRKVFITSPVPCIKCYAPYAQIKGLSISGQSHQDIRDQPAISLGAGHTEFIDCDLTSKSQLIVGSSTQNTSSLFLQCTIHEGDKTGFLLEGLARCKVKQCTFSNNGETHIVLDAESELESYDSTFSASGNHGIFIGKNCSLLLQHCTIEKYAHTGICLRQNRDALLEDSILQEGQKIGLSIIKGHCMVQGGEIKNQQKHAVHVEQDSTLSLSNVKIQHSRSETPALIVLQQSVARLEACLPVDPNDNWHFCDTGSHVYIQNDALPAPTIEQD